MEIGKQLRRQDLFLVRFWLEDAVDGAPEWHGKAQRTVSGEEVYFNNLSELMSLLTEMLSATNASEALKGKKEE